nr:hypothetical protein Iba_chr07eCG6300 [Ipomoea batatas]
MKRKASISSPQSLFGELVCGLVVAGEISFDGFSSVINSWAIATYADWQQQISTFQQFPSGATVCSQLQQGLSKNRGKTTTSGEQVRNNFARINLPDKLGVAEGNEPGGIGKQCLGKFVEAGGEKWRGGGIGSCRGGDCNTWWCDASGGVLWPTRSSSGARVILQWHVGCIVGGHSLSWRWGWRTVNGGGRERANVESERGERVWVDEEGAEGNEPGGIGKQCLGKFVEAGGEKWRGGGIGSCRGGDCNTWWCDASGGVLWPTRSSSGARVILQWHVGCIVGGHSCRGGGVGARQWRRERESNVESERGERVWVDEKVVSKERGGEENLVGGWLGR